MFVTYRQAGLALFQIDSLHLHTLYLLVATYYPETTSTNSVFIGGNLLSWKKTRDKMWLQGQVQELNMELWLWQHIN